MHVPDGHKPPSSWRDFRREYAMIVLSILTALGFERVVVHVHDRGAAQASRARIEQEISANMTDLRSALDSNKESATAVRASLTALIDVAKSANPDPAKERQIVNDTFQHHFGLKLPTWESDAWDAAVADQSASHMDPGDLRRYAQLYTDAKDIGNLTQILLTGSIFDRLADLSADLQLGTIDAREATHVIARFLIADTQITQMQQTLMTEVRKGPVK